MEKTRTNKFDMAYGQFLKEKDVYAHRKTIQALLSKVDLKKEFNELLKDKNNISHFFLLWERARKEGKNPKEKEALREMGIASRKLYEEKKYKKLCELFFYMVLSHLAEINHLEGREDFEEITDCDLYEKNIIPSEIFLQFFLLETLARNKEFDWSRADEILNQSLVCFIVCFGDIYEYFHENE